MPGTNGALAANNSLNRDIAGWLQISTYGSNDCSGSPNSVKYTALGICSADLVNGGYTLAVASQTTSGFPTVQTSSFSDARCTTPRSQQNKVETTISGDCSYLITPADFGRGLSKSTLLINAPTFPSTTFLGMGYLVSQSPSCGSYQTTQYMLINPKEASGKTPNCLKIPSIVDGTYSLTASCPAGARTARITRFDNGQCSGTGLTSSASDLSMALYGGVPSCSYSPQFKGYIMLLSCVSSIGVGSTRNFTMPTSTSSLSASSSLPPEQAWVNSAVVGVSISILILMVAVVMIRRRLFLAKQAAAAAAEVGRSDAPKFGDVIPKREPQTPDPAPKKVEWQSASL